MSRSLRDVPLDLSYSVGVRQLVGHAANLLCRAEDWEVTGLWADAGLLRLANGSHKGRSNREIARSDCSENNQAEELGLVS